MYNNILFFLPVIIVYAFDSPPSPPTNGILHTLFLFFVILATFFLLVFRLFERVSKQLKNNSESLTHFSDIHSKTINHAIIFAILVYIALIYLCHTKWYFYKIPFVKTWDLLANSLGLLPFFILLIIIWYISHKSYKAFYYHRSSKVEYITSNLRFNFPIVIPWLLLCLIFDILKLSPFNTFKLEFDSLNIVFLSIFLFTLAIFFPYLTIRLWKCKPLPHGELRDKIQKLSENLNFKYNNILIWPLFEGKLLTAGVMGIIKKFRYILIAPSLLENLNDKEIEAVILHEIGHVKNMHLIFYLFFILGYLIFSDFFILLFKFLMSSFDSFLYIFIYLNNKIIVSSLVITSLFLIFFFLYFRYAFGIFSRNFERQADIYALKYGFSPDPLVSSFDKLSILSGREREHFSWHHYGIGQRISFILACANNPSLIKRHDRKVGLLKGVFFSLLILGTLFKVYTNYSNMEESMYLKFNKKILLKEVEKEPKNADLHFILGNIYYEQKNFSLAIKSFLTTVELFPENSEALNNIAWILATKKEFYNPYLALKYAQAAYKINKSPHILDTLAESLFINNKIDEAISCIKKAIKKHPPNLSYYQKQLNKFKSAKKAKKKATI